MSGFHPVLGLLAVAVCISFAEGAAFPFILKDESSANELHKSNPDRRLIAEQPNIAQARSLNMNSKHASLSEDKDQQNSDIIVGRNAAYNKRASGFGEVRNLRTAGENALRRQDAAEDRSGNINDQSTRDGGLLHSGASIQSDEDSSSSSDESEKQSNERTSDSASLGSQVSASEENCEEDKETGQSTSSPSVARTSSTTSQPTEQSSDSDTDHHTSPSTPEQGTEDDCDETEPTEPTREGTESSDSSSESQETEEPQSEECKETDEPSDTVTSTKSTRSTTSTTSTTAKTPRKRPDDDGSSGGNFEDTDEFGVDFSDSNSDVSNGESTNLSA